MLICGRDCFASPRRVSQRQKFFKHWAEEGVCSSSLAGGNPPERWATRRAYKVGHPGLLGQTRVSATHENFDSSSQVADEDICHAQILAGTHHEWWATRPPDASHPSTGSGLLAIVSELSSDSIIQKQRLLSRQNRSMGIDGSDLLD